MREQATGKAIGKLRRYKLIKSINKSLRDKGLQESLDDANLTKIVAAYEKRAKLFDITEFGLSCFLLQAQMLDFDSSLLGRRWKSRTIKLLLSPYFEKETAAGRLTTLQFRVIKDFLQDALHIVKQRLSMIEESDEQDSSRHKTPNVRKKLTKYTTSREKQISKLEDDLLWHAKSFALRLMADTSSKDKEKSEESQSILNFLAHDKKFVDLADTAVREILSYHRFGKSLDLDKARPL